MGGLADEEGRKSGRSGVRLGSEDALGLESRRLCTPPHLCARHPCSSACLCTWGRPRAAASSKPCGLKRRSEPEEVTRVETRLAACTDGGKIGALYSGIMAQICHNLTRRSLGGRNSEKGGVASGSRFSRTGGV